MLKNQRKLFFLSGVSFAVGNFIPEAQTVSQGVMKGGIEGSGGFPGGEPVRKDVRDLGVPRKGASTRRKRSALIDQGGENPTSDGFGGTSDTFSGLKFAGNKMRTKGSVWGNINVILSVRLSVNRLKDRVSLEDDRERRTFNLAVLKPPLKH